MRDQLMAVGIWMVAGDQHVAGVWGLWQMVHG